MGIPPPWYLLFRENGRERRTRRTGELGRASPAGTACSLVLGRPPHFLLLFRAETAFLASWTPGPQAPR